MTCIIDIYIGQFLLLYFRYLLCMISMLPNNVIQKGVILSISLFVAVLGLHGHSLIAVGGLLFAVASRVWLLMLL